MHATCACIYKNKDRKKKEKNTCLGGWGYSYHILPVYKTLNWNIVLRVYSVSTFNCELNQKLTKIKVVHKLFINKQTIFVNINRHVICFFQNNIFVLKKNVLFYKWTAILVKTYVFSHKWKQVITPNLHQHGRISRKQK